MLPLLENFLQATDGLLLKNGTFCHSNYFPDLFDEGGAHALLYNCCELIESVYAAKKRPEKYGCNTAINCRCAQLYAILENKWTRSEQSISCGN